MVLVADAGKKSLPIGSGSLEGVPTGCLYHVQIPGVEATYQYDEFRRFCLFLLLGR